MECQICKKTFKAVTNTHLMNSHNLTPKQYENMFGCSTVPEGWVSGEKNPFYGKSHKDGISKVKSEEYRDAASERRKGKSASEFLKNISVEEFRKHQSDAHSGERNPMYGKIWTRERKEKHSRLISREGNPNWRGGITSYRYNMKVWNDNLKNKVRDRDGFRCQLCGIHQNISNKKLAVHHIDYDKFNYSFDNLISLCNSCHPKVSYNREKYMAEFRIKLFLKHGNQQRSLSNVIEKVDRNVQRLDREDITTNNRSTSARLLDNSRMMI